ncbi:MAG: diacylglycerol kinase [Candidatus Dactylopiibacterium carminicum]|uniref:Dihydrofolate reductase n=1 Tax=Candidatus Dactylopiibacterium carminicum TaxID=857335 RepID=A0A272EPP9_9RHOO|nr:dihydrofolate reductase [Candidatus Dactylopiibacterium carminicum]KAF7598484.1 dihydrofolate reductase [Candidatus Dactylopiibacterium carminicum]PAS92079.1 MAG: diacylglycerol kinase [Candidatus Dactylopiibacterium carminicum]PAS95501.1 MAG: diacylglycerol kinase [Candidatus Dactylopiibacterium carminicum]PAS97883.1 MAG: diacylglycerol kinase [Candidatus Dactylopiibacterium carminicum]
MSKPELAIIVARARNGVIGRGNTLPWRLRDDLQQFKQRTLGCPVIMGRKTWESLGRPLPGRHNIVITRQAGYAAAGATVVGTLSAAIAACNGVERAFIIGGAQIYAEALPLADVLWISEIQADIEGDARFPEFDESRFRVASRQSFAASETNDHTFDVVEYRPLA